MNYGTCALLLISIILLHKQGRVRADVQYSRPLLPRLYTFDEYDECFQRPDATELASTYCMVYAEVKPDNTSEMWQNIRTHSEINKFNYRYDRLYFGVCLNRCIEFAQSSFTPDDVVSNKISEHYTNVHKLPLDLEVRRNYSGMIHKCLNHDFQKKYNLKLRTFVRYCEGRNHKELLQEQAKTDPAEYLLKRFIMVVLLLLISSTSYDFYMKLQTPKGTRKEFYKNNLEQRGPRILTSFSICRNYYRLLQPYRTETARNLSFLDGYRSFITLSVLCFHTIYINGLHIENPEFMEYFGNSTLGSMILNMPIALDIFMVMSGLIVYIKFTQSRFVTPQTSTGKCIKLALLLIVHRVLRFLPSVGLLLLVNATFVSRLADGPYWRHLTDQYRVFSRKNWWKNVLMVNNFSLKDTMSPHTWYIAADFQLYIFYITVLIITSKYPQYKYRVFKLLAVLAVAIPTLNTYLLKLGSSYILQNESFRTGIPIESDEYNYQYTPFYNNIGGYLVGICCGDLYLNYVKAEEFRKKMRKYVFTLVVVLTSCAMFMIRLASIVMFKESSIWVAIYTGLFQNIWNIAFSGVPIIFMLCKMGGIAYEFCTLPLFRVYARMSFQIYIWHVVIMQLHLLHLRQPLRINGIYFLSLCLVSIAATALVSFVTTLFLEYPFAQLVDNLVATARRKPAEVAEKPKLDKVE